MLRVVHHRHIAATFTGWPLRARRGLPGLAGRPKLLAAVLAGGAGAAVAAAVLLGGCDTIFPHRGEGEQLYRKLCADCHGFDGAGNTVKSMGNPYADLLDDAWRTGGDDRSITNVIREGVFGQMPAFGEDKLTNAQVASIIRYLRVLRHEKPREDAP